MTLFNQKMSIPRLGVSFCLSRLQMYERAPLLQCPQRKATKYTEDDEKPGTTWDYLPVRSEDEGFAEVEARPSTPEAHNPAQKPGRASDAAGRRLAGAGAGAGGTGERHEGGQHPSVGCDQAGVLDPLLCGGEPPPLQPPPPPQQQQQRSPLGGGPPGGGRRAGRASSRRPRSGR